MGSYALLILVIDKKINQILINYLSKNIHFFREIIIIKYLNYEK